MVVGALVVAVCGWLASVGDGAEQRPNIVLIVADDLGFNEMGFNNASRGLQTPNLDGLAAKGAILRHYYTNPLCSPTRSVCCWCTSSLRLSLAATDRSRAPAHSPTDRR
jgi:arylsulfatase B